MKPGMKLDPTGTYILSNKVDLEKFKNMLTMYNPYRIYTVTNNIHLMLLLAVNDPSEIKYLSKKAMIVTDLENMRDLTKIYKSFLDDEVELLIIDDVHAFKAFINSNRIEPAFLSMMTELKGKGFILLYNRFYNPPPIVPFNIVISKVGFKENYNEYRLAITNMQENMFGKGNVPTLTVKIEPDIDENLRNYYYSRLSLEKNTDVLLRRYQYKTDTLFIK